jgi:hypothetical protein
MSSENARRRRPRRGILGVANYYSRPLLVFFGNTGSYYYYNANGDILASKNIASGQHTQCENIDDRQADDGS